MPTIRISRSSFHRRGTRERYALHLARPYVLIIPRTLATSTATRFRKSGSLSLSSATFSCLTRSKVARTPSRCMEMVSDRTCCKLSARRLRRSLKSCMKFLNVSLSVKVLATTSLRRLSQPRPVIYLSVHECRMKVGNQLTIVCHSLTVDLRHYSPENRRIHAT